MVIDPVALNHTGRYVCTASDETTSDAEESYLEVGGYFLQLFEKIVIFSYYSEIILEVNSYIYKT